MANNPNGGLVFAQRSKRDWRGKETEKRVASAEWLVASERPAFAKATAARPAFAESCFGGFETREQPELQSAKLGRLEMGPIVCFLWLTGISNRGEGRLESGRESTVESRELGRPAFAVSRFGAVNARERSKLSIRNCDVLCLQ